MGRGMRTRTKRLGVGAAVIVGLIPASLAAYAAVAEALFFRRHPPPGRLLDVEGGRRWMPSSRRDGTMVPTIAVFTRATTALVLVFAIGSPGCG